MRRFIIVTAAALLAYPAFSAVEAQAQVVGVQIVRPYTPAYVQPAITHAYYVAPGYIGPSRVPLIAPSYASTIQVVPQSTTVYSYFAPPYYVAPTPSVYTTRTVETRGFLRQRVIITENFYTYP